jgi:hypothetical protein
MLVQVMMMGRKAMGVMGILEFPVVTGMMRTGPTKVAMGALLAQTEVAPLEPKPKLILQHLRHRR